MRLFAAVLPPEPAVDELARFAGGLRTLPGVDADAVRWLDRADWHFTLAFMAEVPAAAVPDLGERLARAALRTAPFPLSLRGGGHFGGRVLWAGADGAVAELRLLADRAEAAAREAGLTMTEHRPYRPHLTLARSRGETDLSPCVDALAAFEGTPWTAVELVLVRSNLPGSGAAGERPRYEAVGRWALGGAGGGAGGAG